MSKSSTYKKTANRLRNELRNKNASTSSSSLSENATHPAGLKGREIGMWYAQRNKRKKELGPQMVNNIFLIFPQNKWDILQLIGPNISLPAKMIEQLSNQIFIIQANMKSSSKSQNARTDFSRYKRMNFMEIIETKVEPFADHESGVLDQILHDEFERNTKTEKYAKMLEFRQRLPAFQHKEEIVDLVKKNQVILVAGNTGCGKTTQVAQYILDNALVNMEGSRTKILCTQPRRIAGM